jgi:hypothetical protein
MHTTSLFLDPIFVLSNHGNNTVKKHIQRSVYCHVISFADGFFDFHRERLRDQGRHPLNGRLFWLSSERWHWRDPLAVVLVGLVNVQRAILVGVCQTALMEGLRPLIN